MGQVRTDRMPDQINFGSSGDGQYVVDKGKEASRFVRSIGDGVPVVAEDAIQAVTVRREAHGLRVKSVAVFQNPGDEKNGA